MMDSSLQKEETITADPFAADIFAAQTPPEEKIEAIESISAETNFERSNLWIRQLPKVSREIVDWDNLFRGLPLEFSDELPRRLAEALAQFLFMPPGKTIEFLFLIKREINRIEELPPENQNSLWLTFGIETERDARITVEIDNAFATWLIDAALGAEENSDGADLRRLTPSELSVLEFLALNLTHEANRTLQSPLFRFRALSPEIPGWLRQKINSETSAAAAAAAASLLALNYQTIHGLLPSIVKMYLAPDSLRALQPNENLLLDKRPSRRPALKKSQNRIKDVRMRLSLGGAELSFAEIAALETGDVILLENQGFYIKGENLSGRAEILFGASESAKVAGELTSADLPFSAEPIEQSSASGDNRIPVRRINLKRALQFRILNFVKEEKQTASENFMTETDENLTGDQATQENSEEQTNGGGGLAVENLAVTLSVELDARRLTLTEIGNLRENQVLELGIRPTDAVNLLIDNQAIGRGELVAVGDGGEDRLGVRITKLLR